MVTHAPLTREIAVEKELGLTPCAAQGRLMHTTLTKASRSGVDCPLLLLPLLPQPTLAAKAATASGTARRETGEGLSTLLCLGLAEGRCSAVMLYCFHDVVLW